VHARSSVQQTLHGKLEMNDKNRQVVRDRIMEAAENLKGKLPPSSKHPRGRNPYAHIPKVIKHLCGMSYTDLPDEDLAAVLEIIDHCEKHPF
jgi:hypothetical protein